MPSKFFLSTTDIIWWIPFTSKSYFQNYLWFTVSWLGLKLDLRFSAKRKYHYPLFQIDRNFYKNFKILHPQEKEDQC